MKRAILAGVVGSLAACSSSPTAPAPAPAAGPKPTIFYFDGKFDPATRTLSVTPRAPQGDVHVEGTLPYGTAAGDVYFHTCPGTEAWSAPNLTAHVQGVNLMTSAVAELSAVIDSVQPTGAATPASGIMASYGAVSPNTATCSSYLTWTFNDTTGTEFSFFGHATGYASPSGLTLFYTLDEGSGSTFGDSSGNGFSMSTISGSWATGHLGTGFNGRAGSSPALGLSGDITISMWIERAGAGTGGGACPRIVSFSSDVFEIADGNGGCPGGADGTLHIYTSALGWTGTGQAFGSNFNHLAITISSGTTPTTTVYWNGTQVQQYSNKGVNLTSAKMWLGTRWSTSAENFNGVYDQVRVFNRALTAADVATLATE